MPLPLSATVTLALESYVPPPDLARMRVVTGPPGSWVPVILRAGATTFGSRVLFRQGRFDPSTPAGLALIAHEAVHVRQYRELGVPRFLAKYLWGAIRSGFRHDLHPMELPAIAIQQRVLAEL